MPLGVDCERLDPRTNLAGIARRMFPPEVADAVLASPEPDRLTRFYRAWTALEAEVKATVAGSINTAGAIPRRRPSTTTSPRP
jgi:4'-phosphopantetheinyl transferase